MVSVHDANLETLSTTVAISFNMVENDDQYRNCINRKYNIMGLENAALKNPSKVCVFINKILQ